MPGKNSITRASAHIATQCSTSLSRHGRSMRRGVSSMRVLANVRAHDCESRGLECRRHLIANCWERHAAQEGDRKAADDDGARFTSAAMALRHGELRCHRLDEKESATFFRKRVVREPAEMAETAAAIAYMQHELLVAQI